jgi:hypothetical protein
MFKNLFNPDLKADELIQPQDNAKRLNEILRTRDKRH